MTAPEKPFDDWDWADDIPRDLDPIPQSEIDKVLRAAETEVKAAEWAARQEQRQDAIARGDEFAAIMAPLESHLKAVALRHRLRRYARIAALAILLGAGAVAAIYVLRAGAR